MNPLLEQYISGDKGGFFELIEAITAHTDHEQRVSLCACQQDGHSQDVRQSAARTKAIDVIQTRKGFVRFIF